MRVLLVEDDASIAHALQEGLVRYGYEVEWVDSGAGALAADPGDLVLLDLGLPDMDGLDVCRQLRQRCDVPIVVITARADEVDTVVGLEVGADDYLAKPFGIRELIARMRAVTRRTRGATGDDEPPAEVAARRRQVLGDLEVDVSGRRVFQSGHEVALAPKEFDLLAVLMESPGSVLTRDQLIKLVWDENWFGSTRTLDVHVAALRRKLGPALPLSTVRGVGFRVEADR